jgi:hypothetical protein
VKQVVAEMHLTLPVLLDSKRKLQNRFGFHTLPLLVFIDRDFNLLREIGLSDQWQRDFIENKRKTIELAKLGKLPEESDSSLARPGPQGGPVKVKLSNGGQPMSEEGRLNVRRRLKQMFPTADDKYLDDAIARIEEGARNGTEVSLTPP